MRVCVCVIHTRVAWVCVMEANELPIALSSTQEVPFLFTQKTCSSQDLSLFLSLPSPLFLSLSLSLSRPPPGRIRPPRVWSPLVALFKVSLTGGLLLSLQFFTRHRCPPDSHLPLPSQQESVREICPNGKTRTQCRCDAAADVVFCRTLLPHTQSDAAKKIGKKTFEKTESQSVCVCVCVFVWRRRTAPAPKVEGRREGEEEDGGDDDEKKTFFLQRMQQ